MHNFHLKPARIQYRISLSENNPVSFVQQHFIQSAHTKIILLSKALPRVKGKEKIPADVIILSKNPPVYISRLQEVFQFKQIVFDSSNPLWKIERWKKDCDSLHLRFHSVPEQGAFEMDL